MEPERKIEKQLRAFAKKRRADAGDEFALHPATRRLLQGEVARRRPPPEAETGWLNLWTVLRRGLAPILFVVVVAVLGAALLLPALSKSKSRAQNMSAASNLKQLGMAAQIYAGENKNRLPVSLAALQRLAGSNTLIDPASGRAFVYVAGGREADSLQPDSVLAYSPTDAKSRAVLFADGRVELMPRDKFSELTNRGLLQLAANYPASAPVAAPAAGQPATVALSTTAGSNHAFDQPMARASAPTINENLGAPKVEIAGPDQKEVSKSAAREMLAASGAVAEKKRGDDTLTWVAKDAGADRSAVAANMLQSNFAAAPPVTQAYLNSNGQQLFRNSAATRKAQAVLANFLLQQNGSAISVVDGDGSVYNGTLLAGDNSARELELKDTAKTDRFEQTKLNTKSPAPGALAQAAQNQFIQNNYFRVSGRNRSLGQNVVFTGNFVTISNLAPSAPTGIARNFGGGVADGGKGGQKTLQNQFANGVPPGALSNLRIAGTALIDSTNSIEINAVPVAP